MDGTRRSVKSVDGVTIGIMTAGVGPDLLLVHGGMGQIEQWEPIWSMLADHWRITAMDRRGRGSSGDSEPYEMQSEFADIQSVARFLAAEQDAPIDVFAHSYGATCTLGAARVGTPLRRIALYEPPGPQTVSKEWTERATFLISEGKPGRAMFSFITEIIGLSEAQFEEYRNAPSAYDVLPIVTSTLPREAEALSQVDFAELAAQVTTPTLLLLGTLSLSWAGEIVGQLSTTMSNAEVAELIDQGHNAIDKDPELIVKELLRFFASDQK
jgi:pimeloyl-ACP methyl ester carboxylesterase